MAERYDVFLSYARADAEQVRRLAENLHNAGLDVFFDEWEIGPGDVLVHRLDHGLNSRNGVLCVTPTALSRPWVAREYAALMTQAVERKLRLIPVLLADAEMPPLLASLVWVDLRTADGPEYERKVRDLIAALKGERPGPPPRRHGEILPRPGTAFRAETPIPVRLRIGSSAVAYINKDGGATEHAPRGLSDRTKFNLWNLDRARHGHTPEDAHLLRDAAASGTATRESALNVRLLEIGEALTREFLDGAAGEALRRETADAERLGFPLELGLEVEDALDDLPWETLRLPAAAGISADIIGPPLALHPNVRLFRAVAGLGPTPALPIPGPLRILVAIGSPEEQNARGELLDMERELDRILDAVEPARKQNRPAYVRVIDRGTVKAIRDALLAERYYVLHITCHAGPGVLILEKEDGSKDSVDARRFCDEILPPGRGVPLVVLAGCATALSVREGEPDKQGEDALPGLARQLLARGVPAVLAMQAPVSDPYATHLGARLYRALATFERPEPLAALAEARRSLEIDRRDGHLISPIDLAEWATPALYLRGPAIPLYDPEGHFEDVQPPPEPRFALGVVVRRVGEFVGRRREERRILQALRDPDGAGVLLHGLGGVGKSTLAAEILKSLSEEGWLIATVFGKVSPDDLLAEVAQRLLGQFQKEGLSEADPRRRLAVDLKRPDLDWEERFQALSQYLLGERPLILLLDNFEDNFIEPTRFEIQNEDLADLLARWLAAPGRSRLLITSRQPFPLPDEAHEILEKFHLGPLSFAETRKLIWRLPALDALSREEQLRAYTEVGGHPRALEYLDALLRGGKARFKDISRRLNKAIEEKGIPSPETWLRDVQGDLDRALAETVTLAVDDVLLDGLLDRLKEVPLAEDLLVGASVYQVPVDFVGFSWQIGQETQDSEDAQRPPLQIPLDFDSALGILLDLGLLSLVETQDEAAHLYFVHPWTAMAVLSRNPIDKIQGAHRRAAGYWRWRVATIPQSWEQVIEELLQARYHHRNSGEIDSAIEVTEIVCSQLDNWGAYRREEQLCREALDWVPNNSSGRAALSFRLGIAVHKRGDYEQAVKMYKESLQVSEEAENQEGVAACYHQLGMVAQERGDHESALGWYMDSLQITEALGIKEGLADSYHQLGALARSRGDYEKALEWCMKSLRVIESLQDRSKMAVSYHELGIVAHEQGDLDQALTWYTKALRLNQALNKRDGLAYSYYQLGNLAFERGDHQQALDWCMKALQVQEEIGNQPGIAACFHLFGNIFKLRGDYQQALDSYKKSLQIKEIVGNLAGISITLGALGALLTEHGESKEAVPLTLKSFYIHLQVNSSKTGTHLYWLKRQQELLGKECFGKILYEHWGEDVSRAVLDLMERFNSESGPSEDSSQTEDANTKITVRNGNTVP